MQEKFNINKKYSFSVENIFFQMSEGQRVREIRGRRTLEVFASPLGVGGSNISNIEKGRSRLSLELAIKIATIYEVSLDWLLLGHEAKPAKTDEELANSVIIDKDELIELQRLALKNTIAAKEKQEESLKNN